MWGEPYRKSDRSVDVYVGKLRHKLELAVPGRRFIHTHFGFGYRFAAEPERRLSFLHILFTRRRQVHNRLASAADESPRCT